MLASIFSSVLHMSLTASFVIAAVCLARLILMRAPKIYSYLLWALVLFRLLCPASLVTSYSLIPAPVSSGAILTQWEDDYVGQTHMFHDNRPEYQAAVDAGRETFPAEEGHYYVVTGSDGLSEPDTVENTVMPRLAVFWLLGIAGMVLYSTYSYLSIRKQVRISVPYHRGIFIADDIRSPFVMGLFRPVIYLPGTLDPGERTFIIAHERYHIRRGDHIFKALGFLVLTIHWFNPLVWLAFSLASRDMEMSCDEAVIRKLGEDVRADYSASLLNLATGHRLFTGTPLAFGEGDPTGRVRNLARWKKPAFWVIVICSVLCAFLATALITDPNEIPSESPETIAGAPTSPTESDNWGISVHPERVSRTGATATFIWHTDNDTEFTYGDFLALERYENGNWVPVEEQPGFEYFVGDSSYPVVDGYGMVHEWEVRFGELPDGHYRLGKEVTLAETGEKQIIYGEFFLPDSILTGPIPLDELPEKYSAEQAMIDGCFVQVDGIAKHNKELFHQFATVTQAGVPSFIRIVDWHYGDNSFCVVTDLDFDGSVYTATWLEDGQQHSREYQHLKHFSGTKEEDNMAYDAYEHYVLVNDENVTWVDIWNRLKDGSHQSAINYSVLDHMTVYSSYTYPIKSPQLPMNPAQAVLEFEGEALVSTTDFDRLEKIWILFQDAEFLGYEPKTHSTGMGLHLILTSQSGETVTVDLDPDNDICIIDGEFVFYGAPDEPCYIEKLWYYLGIEAWPDAVYEKCANAYRAQ